MLLLFIYKLLYIDSYFPIYLWPFYRLLWLSLSQQHIFPLIVYLSICFIYTSVTHTFILIFFSAYLFFCFSLILSISMSCCHLALDTRHPIWQLCTALLATNTGHISVEFCREWKRVKSKFDLTMQKSYILCYKFRFHFRYSGKNGCIV